MGDPVQIADVLLEKTHSILKRLEQDWQGDAQDKALEEIDKDLEEYRELCSKQEKPSNSLKTDVWRQELMKKISNLERELKEMKTVQPTTSTNQQLVSKKSPVKKSAKRTINQTELKSNLKQTERIMDRGFKTARELNEKLELLGKKRDCKEAEVQVSPVSSKLVYERSSASDNESYIRGLAEDVTSLLVQQDVRKAAKKKRVNTRNLVIRSQDERPLEIPRGRRLVVQKLPDNHIRTPLTVHTLPSVDIPPLSGPVVASVDNTGIFLVKHKTLPRSESKTVSGKVVNVRKNEIGVQAELSEKSKNDSLEKLITALGQKYREENVSDNSGKLNELLKNVRSSRQQCEKLNQRDLSFAAKSSSVVKSLSEDEYKSDFEVESIVQDSLTKSSEIPPRISTPKRDVSLLSSKTNSLSEDESLIELQMKRLGLLGKNSKRSSKPAESVSDRKSVFYVKKNGKYVPVNDADSPRVQIIVPEIVVRLPEAVNPEKQTKHDQLIQTDEGFATLTSGDTSSVVEQLHKRFERTELLLERIGGRDLIGDELLGLLRRRYYCLLLIAVFINFFSRNNSGEDSFLKTGGTMKVCFTKTV